MTANSQRERRNEKMKKNELLAVALVILMLTSFSLFPSLKPVAAKQQQEQQVIYDSIPWNNTTMPTATATTTTTITTIICRRML